MWQDELEAWLRLSLTPGIGSTSARRLLAAFGLPACIFEQPLSALERVVSTNQAQALRELPPDFAAQCAKTRDWCEQAPAQRRIVTLGDALYPALLLQTEDPPLMLYALGSAAAFEASTLANLGQRSLALVGSRNPTPQGRSNARHFAQNLAQSGWTVVSGMALGVDGAAHEGALDGASTDAIATIAVVGTGLDRVYPRQHRELAHQIAQRGLLLSEYPLGTPPLAANFPKRNRIIAGLTRGTLVVEAALQSGSLITARLATEQGREVFAIPGSIHSPQSRGCHALIKQGAKLVECAQDVLDELGDAPPIAALGDVNFVAAKPDSIRAEARFEHEDPLLSALGFDPVGLDALQARTGWPTPQLQAALMTLELDGQVARLPGGLFQRQGRG